MDSENVQIGINFEVIYTHFLNGETKVKNIIIYLKF